MLVFLVSLIPVVTGGSILSTNNNKDNERLRFDVTSSRSLNQPPSVQVTFSNGVQDELELTEYKPYGSSSNAGCNFLGRLRNDVASSAAVTGCLNKPGDIMEVTLISKNNINKLFKVDFDGNAEVLANPFEHGAQSRAIPVDRDDNGWHLVGGDEEKNDKIELEAAKVEVGTIPSKLKAVIKFGYDEGWKNAFTGTNFNDWIASVLTHSQAHYKDPSLGTEVTLEIQGDPLYQAGAFWTADENLSQATAASAAAGLNDVTAFSWFVNQGGGGVAGIAWVGTLCMHSGYNTNLNEAYSSQAVSAFILSHELGHNFGMSHDFDDSHGGQGGPCDNTGIMSYGSTDYTGWSTCSRSDFERHYASRNWANCLEDISDTTEAPTTAAPSTAAPTEAPPATETTPGDNTAPEYFLADGGKTCTEACKDRGGKCNLAAIEYVAGSVSICKETIESLGKTPTRGGRYRDDNSGCTYHPGQTGWFQVMDNGKGTTCDARNRDRSRQRVCACGGSTDTNPTCKDHNMWGYCHEENAWICSFLDWLQEDCPKMCGVC